MNTPALPGEKIWTFEALKDLKERIESYGLKWTAIENVPLIFYDKVILGLPGRDEQIENYCQTIRNMGKLGIPMPVSYTHLVKRAVSMFHSRKIGLIGHNFIMFNLSDIKKIGGAQLSIYNVAIPNDPEEIKPAVEAAMDQAAEDGCDTFICGNYGYSYGKRKGLNVIFQDISFEEAWHAIVEAQHSAVVYSRQRLKTEFYKNILDHSFEGRCV